MAYFEDFVPFCGNELPDLGLFIRHLRDEVIYCHHSGE